MHPSTKLIHFIALIVLAILGSIGTFDLASAVKEITNGQNHGASITQKIDQLGPAVGLFTFSVLGMLFIIAVSVVIGTRDER